MIEDKDGKEIWQHLFGLEAFMVDWDTFVGGLRNMVTDISEEESRVLQYILDNSNTGYINSHKFSEFLKGFGEVQDAVKNVRNIMSAKWCYGFLSRNEVDLLLRDQEVGTFLIRFSSSQPGSFALAFSVTGNNGEKTVVHILITSCGTQGFQVQEQQNQSTRTFQNVHEIVDYYSIFLQYPFQSEIPFESWFEGDYSGNEAVEALTGQAPGTFMVRFSSQPGCYAISFVTVDGSVTHSLVEHEGVYGNGYRIVNEGQPMVFSTLREVVQYYGEALKYPLKEITNTLQLQAVKYVLQWKSDREKKNGINFSICSRSI